MVPSFGCPGNTSQVRVEHPAGVRGPPVRCGHEGSVSSCAIYKGRCRSCRRDAFVPAAPGERSSVGAVPPNPKPACSSPQTLTRAEPPSLS